MSPNDPKRTVVNQYQLQTLLTRSRDVIGLTQMAICRALVALARIWREILKLIRLTFPLFGIYRRVAFDRYIGPGFCVITVELEPLLGSVLGVGLDRFDRTFRLTYPTIDAFVGMDDEHVFALVETIDGAYLHAIHQLALDAGFIDDISQMSSSLWQRQPYQICLCGVSAAGVFHRFWDGDVTTNKAKTVQCAPA